MKLFNIIKKNFILLFRNKTSSMVILLGPLIVVLIIGLAFNNAGSDYLLTIGVYSEGYSNSTNVFIDGLDEQYELNKFDSNQTCIDSVKKGSSNLCIIFPKDMSLDDENQDELILYIDESRVNLVDTVINRISAIIGVSSESTSKDLTASLLTTISLTKTELESNLFRTINIKQNTDSLLSDTGDVESDVSSMDLEMGSVDMGDIDSKVEDLNTRAMSVQNEALSAIKDAMSIINESSDLYTDLSDSYNYITDRNVSSSYDDIEDELDSVADEIDDVESQLSSAKLKKSSSVTKLTTIKSNLNSIKSDISQLKLSLEAISDSISSIKVLSADSIVNPVTTTIRPITSNASKSTYMLPFLIILVVMFIGIMLSGTSIVLDKMSPAAFRTFASPTKDSYYVLAYYITNILIILLQLAIIGGLALIVFQSSILSNAYLTILIIFLSSTFFVLVGMTFGYLFKSQEAVMIASLSFSSLMLFVSNLVIPLETLPILVQKISSYNPYVFLSELLRKSMLFNVNIVEVIGDLGLILLYILIMIILILIIQKLSKMIFFRRVPHKKSKNATLSANDVLRLSNGKFIRNKRDLLNFLETCENSEFREFVTHENNRLRVWLKDVLKEKNLARKLKKVTNKNRMIEIVERDVAKGATNR